MIKYQGLSELEILEEAKNYNKWIIKQFLPFIEYPILEVGSGTGNISKFFVNNKGVTLSDIDEDLVKKLKKKFNNTPINTVKLNIEGTISDSNKKKYQSILAINVLEHIKSDQRALNNMYRMLKKNGRVLLLVPAKRFAYSRLDKSLGHYRRYEKDEFMGKLEKAGFTIKELYFFNIVGLLSWAIRDKIEKEHHMKSWQVALFDKIVPILSLIENVIRPPVGISLIAIAEKKS